MPHGRINTPLIIHIANCTPFAITRLPRLAHAHGQHNPAPPQLGGLLTEDEIAEFVEVMDADRSGAISVSG